MKKISLNRQFLLAVRMLALFLVVTTFFPGCAKFKEEFSKGMEEGQRRAKEESNTTDAAEVQPEPTPITLSADNLHDELLTNLSNQKWKYRAGDDASWAEPAFNDTDWETLTPLLVNNFVPPKSGWNGIGWFRLHLNVDESLANQPLSLTINHTGASEIYVDGKLMQKFGVVAANAEQETTYNPHSMPVGITFSSPGTHTIALRYSNTEAKKYAIEQPAFQLRLAPLNSTIVKSLDNTALIKSVKGGTFGICLALGLLHLLLFILYPRQTQNLFYSLFLLAEASSNFISETFFSHVGAGAIYFNVMIGMVTGSIYFVAFTAYLYTVLEKRLPRYLRVMGVLWLLSFLMVVASILGFGMFLSVFIFTVGMLIFIGLMVWHIVAITIVIIRAIARKVENSWVLGIVGVTFIISSLSSTVLAIAFGENSSYLFISQFICLTILTVANAIFLARLFARTSTDLEKQLVKEVEHEKEKSRLLIVEAENERRAQELEEARQLQLSMLPKKLPQLPNLEIAAYMKPATEVGGDYYDFHVSEDSTLTVAVGDATGHGLKAGTVVTATKSLFANLASAPHISDTLNQISRSLKAMNLRGLFMAMALLKIKDGVMTLCVAGMPSVLIYRAASKTVEEIAIRAMPLGSLTKVDYQQQTFSLESGDCILLMSDGFPEMFNSANEMIGFEKAAQVLPQLALNSSQEIINQLVKIGEEWAGTRPADDDVTFVALKVI
jgi:serine phosphatase RsbU (regulator of sigma subunit)